ncbi:MAG: hypothetical protein ACR2LN_01710 [Candidatus Levyibacteriota bacterium]
MLKLIKSTFYKENVVKKELDSFIKNAEVLSFGKECITFEKILQNGKKGNIVFLLIVVVQEI